MPQKQSTTQFLSMTNLLLIFLLIIASSVPLACNSKIKVNDGDIVYISCENMQKALTNNQSKKHPIIIIDPRSPDEYMLGHIENAINIPLPQVQKDDPILKNAKAIFICGRYSEDILAKAMCKKLLALGYDNVKMYRGGIEEWKARQLPISTGNDQ